jgi:hypothetical protein
VPDERPQDTDRVARSSRHTLPAIARPVGDDFPCAFGALRRFPSPISAIRFRSIVRALPVFHLGELTE